VIQETFGMVVHGGAFWIAKDYSLQRQFINDLLRLCQGRLADGDGALDVVTEAVKRLEDSGLYVAGKGSGPNTAGYFELDASLMDGATKRAGAVASLRHFQNPVVCARTVMEKSQQVLLVAEGAENFMMAQGIQKLADVQSYFVPIAKASEERKLQQGTVGAVVLDKQGNLAAATSTGGMIGKPEGRVGDTPIIGAATWADEDIAVSTTGVGEYFIRAAAAHDVMARCKYGNVSIEAAVTTVLYNMKSLGGSGGIISINKRGEIDARCNALGMHGGWVRGNEPVHVIPP